MALSLAALSALSAGCTARSAAPTVPTATTLRSPTDVGANTDTGSGSDVEATEAAPRAASEEALDFATTTAEAAQDDEALAKPTVDERSARRPGDYVVYRFSGSFRKAPLTLTERVVAKEGTFVVIDLTLEDAQRKESLRIHMNDSPSSRGEVLTVSRIDEMGVLQPADVETYDALMARTSVAADENEEFLGVEEVAVDVGGTKLACRTASYRVKIGAREATLRTTESDGFAWGDVAGEITAKDGRVIYRAEVVELGHAQPNEVAVAQWDYE